MTNSDLINAAKRVCNPLKLGRNFSAGAVGAAILTAKGNIYTGICIDLACGLGFCAEASAVAEMLKHRETHIIKVVIVFDNGKLGGAPCGRCREMIAQVDARNLGCKVILNEGEEVTLRELLPLHWLENKRSTKK